MSANYSYNLHPETDVFTFMIHTLRHGLISFNRKKFEEQFKKMTIFNREYFFPGLKIYRPTKIWLSENWKSPIRISTWRAMIGTCWVSSYRLNSRAFSGIVTWMDDSRVTLRVGETTQNPFSIEVKIEDLLMVETIDGLVREDLLRHAMDFKETLLRLSKSF